MEFENLMDQDVRSSREKLISALGAAIRRQQRATDRFDQAVVELAGLKRSEGLVVDLLQQYGPMTAGDVAREAHLSSGAVTAVVDRLVEKGFVQRSEDPSDRRRVLVELRPETQRACGEIFGPLHEEAVDLLSKFTVAQLEAILEYVELDIGLHERHADALGSGGRRVALPTPPRRSPRKR
jgi:DNA-binding MarR family transcriptional regulator